MKLYRVKEEFIDSWTNEYVGELVVSDAEVKRLAKEWEVTKETLLLQVEPLESETVKVERFHIGDYYVEVEERNDPAHGLMWDAWISKGNYGIKSYMTGVLADQTRAFQPHVYTRDEALELIFAQIDRDIEIFDDDVRKFEEEE